MRADSTVTSDIGPGSTAAVYPNRNRNSNNHYSAITSPIDASGAIRKPGVHNSNNNHLNHPKATALSRARSSSAHTTHADRLYNLALDLAPSATSNSQSITPTSAGLNWLTPQPSPQPHAYSTTDVDSIPEWPTPPHSDSGVPPVCIDPSKDTIVATNIVTSPELAFDEPSNNPEMSSLGFLLPTHYGSNVLDTEPGSYTMDGNFIPPVRQHAQVSSAMTSASHTVSSSPAMYQRRMTPVSNGNGAGRSMDLLNLNQNGDSGFGHDFRRPNSHYGSPVPNGADYSVGPAQAIRPMGGMQQQSPLPSPPIGGMQGATMMPQYHASMTRSASQGMYDSAMYAPSYTSNPASIVGPSPHQHNQHPHQPHPQPYVPQHAMSYPPPFVGSSVNEVLGKPMGNAASSIRMLNQRPKPQCWEHGCNGRQFSTFSNLLRHQREKSGTATKSYCPKCGAEFTRTTARNGHVYFDKCTKNGSRRQSDGSK